MYVDNVHAIMIAMFKLLSNNKDTHNKYVIQKQTQNNHRNSKSKTNINKKITARTVGTHTTYA